MSTTTTAIVPPLRLVLYTIHGDGHGARYHERLECGHDWYPKWRNSTGTWRVGINFNAMRRRCSTCAEENRA